MSVFEEHPVMDWNAFRKAHSGQGKSVKELSDLYKSYKLDNAIELGDSNEVEDPEIIDAVAEVMESPELLEIDTSVEEIEQSPNESTTVAEEWWRSGNSILSNTFPEVHILKNKFFNKGLILSCLGLIILQLFNILFGLALNHEQVRTNTVIWWNFFFGGLDSRTSPYFSDPLGLVILLLASIIFWNTRPDSN